MQVLFFAGRFKNMYRSRTLSAKFLIQPIINLLNELSRSYPLDGRFTATMTHAFGMIASIWSHFHSSDWHITRKSSIQ